MIWVIFALLVKHSRTGILVTRIIDPRFFRTISFKPILLFLQVMDMKTTCFDFLGYENMITVIYTHRENIGW